MEEKNDGSSTDIRLLVTVGSTSFPALTEFMTSEVALSALNSMGVTESFIQYGSHAPLSFDATKMKLKVDLFSYTPSLSEYMQSADVVVSHAGAGTVLEAVDSNKPLIVVVNSSLMDNHQTELARAMCARACCAVVDKEDLENDLISTIRDAVVNREEWKQRANPPRRQKGIFTSLLTQELTQCVKTLR